MSNDIAKAFQDFSDAIDAIPRPTFKELCWYLDHSEDGLYDPAKHGPLVHKVDGEWVLVNPEDKVYLIRKSRGGKCAYG
jgi:hypothetical protein